MKATAAAAAVVLIISFNFVLLVSAQSKTSDEFPEKSEKCFQKERLPSTYKARFQSFQYPNEDIVHKNIHCVSSELDIWSDANGFNVEKISQQYRGRANEEIIKLYQSFRNVIRTIKIVIRNYGVTAHFYVS